MRKYYRIRDILNHVPIVCHCENDSFVSLDGGLEDFRCVWCSDEADVDFIEPQFTQITEEEALRGHGISQGRKS